MTALAAHIDIALADLDVKIREPDVSCFPLHHVDLMMHEALA